MTYRTGKNDISIWRSFRRGNKAAFQKIYIENYRFLYNYCRKFTGDKALVEDVVQDVFINVFSKRDRLSDTDNIRLYLFCSVRRQLFRVLNTKQYKNTDLFAQDSPEFNFSEGVDPVYVEDETENCKLRVLYSAINMLGERQKEVIYMRYFSGFNNKEIAQILGISYQTVRNTLSIALKKIRKQIENELPKGKMIVLMNFFKEKQ